MTRDELLAFQYLAKGHGHLLVDSYNEVRRIRTWMKEHYPHLTVWVKSDERTRKIRVRVKEPP